MMALVHVNFRTWLRLVAIGFAVFAGYLAVSVLFYQDSADDPPAIVSLFSK
jgi:hypothetical protein